MKREGKANYVHGVFEKIAHRYDLMNKLMSFGLHTRWKARTLVLSGIDLNGAKVLDLGCGTGDYIEIAIVQSKGKLAGAVGVDFSERMLTVAKARLEKYMLNGMVELHRSDVKDLSFLPDEEFSIVTCGFTLRNVDDIERVLSVCYKKLKVGGAFVSLDLNKPVPLLTRPFSYLYVRFILPLLAKLVVDARKEYLWLFESLKTFPSRGELTELLKRAKFSRVKVMTFGLGVLCAHIAYKD